VGLVTALYVAEVNFSYTCSDTRVGELECSLLSARKEAEEAREQILSLEAASRASTSGLTQQMEDLRYSHKGSVYFPLIFANPVLWTGSGPCC
jgi:hypothetical protein